MQNPYPFQWCEHQPENSNVLGEGQFLAPKSQVIALTQQLLKIPQGEYVTRVLSSHVQSIASTDQGMADAIEESTIFYSLGEPVPHPDNVHIIIPFKTYLKKS